MKNPVQTMVDHGARRQVETLLGFWALWHYYRDEPETLAMIVPKVTLWRRRQEFEAAFGTPVEEFAPEAGAALGATLATSRRGNASRR